MSKGPHDVRSTARKIWEQSRLRLALTRLVEHGSLAWGGPQSWFAGEKYVCSTTTIQDLQASGLAVAPARVALPTALGKQVFEDMKSFHGHHCHARGCTTECKPEHLMCGKHWKMVSRKTQTAVWEAYRPGQCEGEPSPSAAWHRAADRAINEVARKEGLPEKKVDEDLYRSIDERGKRG